MKGKGKKKRVIRTVVTVILLGAFFYVLFPNVGLLATISNNQLHDKMSKMQTYFEETIDPWVENNLRKIEGFEDIVVEFAPEITEDMLVWAEQKKYIKSVQVPITSIHCNSIFQFIETHSMEDVIDALKSLNLYMCGNALSRIGFYRGEDGFYTPICCNYSDPDHLLISSDTGDTFRIVYEEKVYEFLGKEEAFSGNSFYYNDKCIYDAPEEKYNEEKEWD